MDQAEYKYGFNSKENDNEVYGDANFQDYGMRMYDTRVGRFISVDPLTTEYPWYTPYQFAGNKPIWAVDLDGEEESIAIWNRGANNRMSQQTYVKWNTLFPGEKNGPMGPGTATIIRKEFVNYRNHYSSEMELQFSSLNEKNKVEMYKGTINTNKSQSFMQKFKKWDDGLAGGDDGANIGSKGDDMQDLQVASAVIGSIITGGTIMEGLVAGAATISIFEWASSGVLIACDIDQMTTDNQGNTFIERSVNDPGFSAAYNFGQFAIGGVSRGSNLINIGKEGPSTFKILDYFSGTLGVNIDAIDGGQNAKKAFNNDSTSH